MCELGKGVAAVRREADRERRARQLVHVPCERRDLEHVQLRGPLATGGDHGGERGAIAGQRERDRCRLRLQKARRPVAHAQQRVAGG
jgi:hypothetical protein